MIEVSRRIRAMQESPIRKLVPLAEQARERGTRVIHLNIGQPDIRTPVEFMDSIRRFDREVIAYSFSQGEPSLIEAIRDYYGRYGMSFSGEEILITHGGSEALWFTLLATTDPGDEILVPEPFYTNYNGFSEPVNVQIVPITTTSRDGFSLPPEEQMDALVTPKTRAILFSNPGNPTGAVYSEEEIDRIARVAARHGLYVIADEVYREFVYDDRAFTSMGTRREIEGQVILVDSISKRFSACGARVGSIASRNRPLIAQILKLCQARLCAAILEQVGAESLYRMDPGYFTGIRQEYMRRRDLLHAGLNAIDGVSCLRPRGAFYLVADLPVDDADDFSQWILRDFQLEGDTLMMAPAEGFYRTPGLGRNQVRLAYVLEEEMLARAVAVLENGLTAYRQRG